MCAIGGFSFAQVNHQVQTAGTSFSPNSLTIEQGDTVTFTNTGGTHNVNGTQTTFPSNPESFGNSVGSGWSFFHKFNVPGTYNYQCDPHSGAGMTGTITVTPTASVSENSAYYMDLVRNQEFLNLSTNHSIENVEIVIFDMQGKQIRNSHSNAIRINNLESGSYIIQVKNNSDVLMTRKMVF